MLFLWTFGASDRRCSCQKTRTRCGTNRSKSHLVGIHTCAHRKHFTGEDLSSLRPRSLRWSCLQTSNVTLPVSSWPIARTVNGRLVLDASSSDCSKRTTMFRSVSAITKLEPTFSESNLQTLSNAAVLTSCRGILTRSAQKSEQKKLMPQLRRTTTKGQARLHRPVDL